jgi:hypothetical protein
MGEKHMGLFGSPKKEIWQQLAKDINANYIELY